jgi:hypothetical protein
VPRATDCLIGVDFAKKLKKLVEAMPVKVKEGDIGFRCKECGKPVRPFESKTESAHFEHVARNKKCSLSDPARS